MRFDDLPRLSEWRPPGTRTDTGIWITDAVATSRFPEGGVDVFRAVDEASFWFLHRNQVILELLRSAGLSKQPFLEVGSGSGVVAHFLARAGVPVACVEPIERGAVQAYERGVDPAYCGDLSSLSLPDGSLPAIGLFDVIEHIADPIPLLQECRRVCAEDGALLVTVPAHQWLWSEFDDWNGHIKRYTQSLLRQELGEAGFEVERSSHFFTLLVAPAVVDRVILDKFRRAKSADEIERKLQANLDISSRIVDRILAAVMSVERRALGRFSLPIGTSIVAMARPARA